jgi:hypothetical protein
MEQIKVIGMMIWVLIEPLYIKFNELDSRSKCVGGAIGSFLVMIFINAYLGLFLFLLIIVLRIRKQNCEKQKEKRKN